MNHISSDPTDARIAGKTERAWVSCSAQGCKKRVPYDIYIDERGIFVRIKTRPASYCVAHTAMRSMKSPDSPNTQDNYDFAQFKKQYELYCQNGYLDHT
jgi:hypothetical protein